MTTSVYVLKCESTGLVKVGVARTPIKRNKEVSVGKSARAVIVHVEPMLSGTLARRVERSVHAALSSRRTPHPEGGSGVTEWFDTGASEAINYVKAAKVAVDSGLLNQRAEPRSSTSGAVVEGDGLDLGAFGRALGITYNGVKKAIKSGRIPMSYVAVNARGKYRITDPAQAAMCWANATTYMRNGSREVEYGLLPEEVKKARMLRDLMVAKLAEAKIKQIDRAVPRQDAVRKNAVKLAVRSAINAEIQGAPAGVRSVIRAALLRVENKVMKEIM